MFLHKYIRVLSLTPSGKKPTMDLNLNFSSRRNMLGIIFKHVESTTCQGCNYFSFCGKIWIGVWRNGVPCPCIFWAKPVSMPSQQVSILKFLCRGSLVIEMLSYVRMKETSNVCISDGSRLHVVIELLWRSLKWWFSSRILLLFRNSLSVCCSHLCWLVTYEGNSSVYFAMVTWLGQLDRMRLHR